MKMKQKSHKYPGGTKDASLEKKAAKIFEAMGYEVEYNRCFSGGKVDVFVKRKHLISSDYESWVCLVDNGNQKVRKDAVDGLYHTWEMVKKELAKESNLYDDCQAMFISAKGFTKGAITASRKYWIELRTLELLRDDMEEFIKVREKLCRDFDDLLRTSADISKWETTPLTLLCMSHLVLLRTLRMLVKKHKDWDLLEYDSVEKRAVEIIKLVGYDE